MHSYSIELSEILKFNGSNMKILIAEDAPVNQVLLTSFLSPYGECHVVSDGDAAIEAFEKSLDLDILDFDLVCLDIMMPKRDGQAVLQKIREMERERGIGSGQQVKVLMITALDDSENIMEALVKGQCEGYLTKPVSRVTLQNQLGMLGIS